MCEPTLLAGIGTLGSAYSQYQAANAQADVAEQNAKISEAKINDVEYQKQQQLAQIQERKKQMLGSQRAAMAANGIDSGYGSGLSALLDTAYSSQKDLDETENNASKQEWGYQVEANNYRNQASVARSSAKGALFGGVLGAAGKYYAGMDAVSPKWNTAANNRFTFNNKLRG